MWVINFVCSVIVTMLAQLHKVHVEVPRVPWKCGHCQIKNVPLQTKCVVCNTDSALGLRLAGPQANTNASGGIFPRVSELVVTSFAAMVFTMFTFMIRRPMAMFGMLRQKTKLRESPLKVHTPCRAWTKDVRGHWIRVDSVAARNAVVSAHCAAASARCAAVAACNAVDKRRKAAGASPTQVSLIERIYQLPPELSAIIFRYSAYQEEFDNVLKHLVNRYSLTDYLFCNTLAFDTRPTEEYDKRLQCRELPELLNQLETFLRFELKRTRGRCQENVQTKKAFLRQWITMFQKNGDSPPTFELIKDYQPISGTSTVRIMCGGWSFGASEIIFHKSKWEGSVLIIYNGFKRVDLTSEKIYNETEYVSRNDPRLDYFGGFPARQLHRSEVQVYTVN